LLPSPYVVCSILDDDGTSREVPKVSKVGAITPAHPKELGVG